MTALLGLIIICIWVWNLVVFFSKTWALLNVYEKVSSVVGLVTVALCIITAIYG